MNKANATAIGDVTAKDHYVMAHGLGLNTVRVRGFSGIDLDIMGGTAHAVCGENKSGKTELLLVLAGRMHANEGTFSIGGTPVSSLRDVNALRRTSGLGFFDNVNDVSRALRVRTVVSAELDLAGRTSGRAATDRYLDDWDLGGVASRTIESLPSYTYALLGIALGMCGDPSILVVHDIERDLTPHQSLRLLHTLRGISHDRGVTVVCGVTDYELGARFDGVTCISEDSRAQREAFLRGGDGRAA